MIEKIKNRNNPDDRMRFAIIFIIYYLSLFASVSLASSPSSSPISFQDKNGIIKGQVLDGEIKSPLSGAKIRIVGLSLEATSDAQGYFSFSEIPIGSYSLEVYLPFYQKVVKPDIIVRSERITWVIIELFLEQTYKEHEEITVTSDYYSAIEKKSSSLTQFSNEEIRRAAGSGGDISRAMQSLPSITSSDDTKNNLIVRGGSPLENLFFIDNIRIPNINHYPTQGSTGGPIGLLNVDLIREVQFAAGGYSSIYGNGLSSVMEITLREGNRDSTDFQLDLSMAGMGVIGEGPWSKKKGSWLFSLRRSYVDLLTNFISEGEVNPRWADLQIKLTYDLGSKHKISVVNVGGLDQSGQTKENAQNQGENFFGDHNSTENTLGLNWLFMWGKNGYSSTTLSSSIIKYDINFSWSDTGSPAFENKSREHSLDLRNINFFKLNDKIKSQFGLEASYYSHNYKYFLGETTDPAGNFVSSLSIDRKIHAFGISFFTNFTMNPSSRLNFNLGLREDYFSFNKKWDLSPRFSLSYEISPKTIFNVATGIYSQHLPLALLSQQEKFKKLPNPKAYHFNFGFNYFLAPETKMTLEFYDKEYRSLPLDPNQPFLFILDEIFDQGFFSKHEDLMSTGQGRAYGVEFWIQKKLARKIYGLLGGTYFHTQYKDLSGKWRNRIFDNRIKFVVDGGWKISKNWEASLKWHYSGGMPSTPFDEQLSKKVTRGIIDENRTSEFRLPAYHSLSVRLDRRFYFRSSNLVIYLSIWNLYNRKNVAYCYWNVIEQKPDYRYQWGILPVLGLEFEF